MPRAAPVAAPQWFVRLVEPGATELRRPTRGRARADAEIVVRADPGDEIAESWEDARPLLLLVLVVSIIANGLLYFVIGRWLKPVERIVAAMDGIEQGDYRARLPAFELPSFATVAGKFNRMAEVLERSREENRHLAQQSIAIQEAERRALAHELHDELGQSIAAINAVAASIEGGAGRSGAATIAEIAARMHAVVRGMLRRLRPCCSTSSASRERSKTSSTAGTSGTRSFLPAHRARSYDDLGDDAGISLYRVVQECLTNASKHSGASEIPSISSVPQAAAHDSWWSTTARGSMRPSRGRAWDCSACANAARRSAARSRSKRERPRAWHRGRAARAGRRSRSLKTRAPTPCRS